MNEEAAPVELESTPPAWTEKAGGRKFLVTILGLTLATILQWNGKLPGDVWMYVAIAAMTGYAGLNVVQKAVTK